MQTLTAPRAEPATWIQMQQHVRDMVPDIASTCLCEVPLNSSLRGYFEKFHLSPKGKYVAVTYHLPGPNGQSSFEVHFFDGGTAQRLWVLEAPNSVSLPIQQEVIWNEGERLLAHKVAGVLKVYDALTGHSLSRSDIFPTSISWLQETVIERTDLTIGMWYPSKRTNSSTVPMGDSLTSSIEWEVFRSPLHSLGSRTPHGGPRQPPRYPFVGNNGARTNSLVVAPDHKYVAAAIYNRQLGIVIVAVWGVGQLERRQNALPLDHHHDFDIPDSPALFGSSPIAWVNDELILYNGKERRNLVLNIKSRETYDLTHFWNILDFPSLFCAGSWLAVHNWPVISLFNFDHLLEDLQDNGKPQQIEGIQIDFCVSTKGWDYAFARNIVAMIPVHPPFEGTTVGIWRVEKRQ